MNAKQVRAAALKCQQLVHTYYGRVKITGLVEDHGGNLQRVEMRSASYEASERRAIERKHGQCGNAGGLVLTAKPHQFRLLRPIGGAS